MDVSDKSRDGVSDYNFETSPNAFTIPTCKVEPDISFAKTVGEDNVTTGDISLEEDQSMQIEALLCPEVKVEVEDEDPFEDHGVLELNNCALQEYFKKEVKTEENDNPVLQECLSEGVKTEENLSLHGYNKESKSCEEDDYILPDRKIEEDPVVDMTCGINYFDSSSNNFVEQSYECESEQYATENEALFPTKYAGTQENTFVCDICGQSFCLESELVEHTPTHNVHSLYKCVASNENVIIVSNRTPLLHTSELQFKCDECNKYFSKKDNLKKHLRTHTGLKPFKCDICDKCFVRRDNLDKHARIHTGKKPFKCDYCDKSFTQKDYLNKHTRSHTECSRIEWKSFKCSSCDKCYRWRGDLDKHERTHTGQKPFICDVCNKSFSQKVYLYKHKHIHTGQKPFKCDQCDKCFARKDKLKIHSLVHTGEKPFKCDWCNKYFSRKNDLISHTRTHTKEKPFKCVWCGKCFPRKDSLNKHTYIHTGKKRCK